MLSAAAGAGIPIWGDVELAWRLDAAGHYGPPRRWLVVTGTNGKTTTTSMLHAMLVADGRSAQLCGNIGDPVLDVLARPSELLCCRAVQLSVFWAPFRAARRGRGAQHRRGPPRLARQSSAYADAKAGALSGRVAVVGLDDEAAASLLPGRPRP